MRQVNEHNSNFGGLGPVLGPGKAPQRRWSDLDERCQRRLIQERTSRPGIVEDADGKMRTDLPENDGHG